METLGRFDRFFEANYCVIDLLPKTVPEECASLYGSMERFFREEPLHAEIAGRFSRFLLKLGCYYAFRFFDPETEAEYPADSAKTVFQRIGACLNADRPCALLLFLPEDDALITLDRDDLYLTLYDPSPALLDTVRPLAAAEGLFVRFPEEENAAPEAL